MTNKEKLEDLLADLNKMSKDVIRFKENLQCHFEFIESKYPIEIIFKKPAISLRIHIQYIDKTLSIPKVLVSKTWEILENSESVIDSVYGLVYQEFLRYLIFLVPAKYTTNLGTFYTIPIKDLINKGYEKCTKEIDENELRSNSENKE